VATQRDCKLLHEPSGRFLSARTRDVSPTGALLDVITPRDLLTGERVRVAIAWDARRARVALSALRTGVIVREAPTTTAGPERRFAIRFDQPDALPLGVEETAAAAVSRAA
jgi:hypothetical protein